MNTDTNTLNVGWDQNEKKTVLFQHKRLSFCETVMAGVTGHKSTGSTFECDHKNSHRCNNGASSATGQHSVAGNVGD